MKKNPYRILITGGSGFLGRTIIEALKDNQDYQIVNLSRSPVEGVSNLINIPCQAETYDFQQLDGQFDYIIHLLALSNDRYCSNFGLAEQININFTKAVLQYALGQTKLKKLIYLSSIIFYDNTNKPPVTEKSLLNYNYTNYSFTKGVAEAYVHFYEKKHTLPILIFRLSNIYGPFQDPKDSPFLVPSKICEGLTQKKITVFNLEPKRDWIYSLDAAQAIIKSLKTPLTGIYNLGGGVGLSVEEIISEIAHQLNVPYESLSKPTTGPLNFFCDISKLKKDLDWQPTTNLHTGLKQTIAYMKGRLPL